MDNLTKEMRICERAGFGASYGKWKATQPIKQIPKVEQGKCAWCGTAILDGKKYCSAKCKSDAGYKGKIPAYSLDNGVEEVERKCVWCGKVFPLTRKSRIYCSNNCNALATYYRRKAANEAEKNGND